MYLAEKALVFRRGSVKGNIPYLWTRIAQEILHCIVIHRQNCPFAYDVLSGLIMATYYLQLSITLLKPLIAAFCLFFPLNSPKHL